MWELCAGLARPHSDSTAVTLSQPLPSPAPAPSVKGGLSLDTEEKS